MTRFAHLDEWRMRLNDWSISDRDVAALRGKFGESAEDVTPARQAKTIRKFRKRERKAAAATTPATRTDAREVSLPEPPRDAVLAADDVVLVALRERAERHANAWRRGI